MGILIYTDEQHPYPPTYPSIGQASQTLRIRWYRSPLGHERLRQLSERTDRQGWLQAGGHLAVYLVFASLTVVLWLQQAWLAMWVSLWCLGFVASFFNGTAPHELGHGTVFRTRYLNRVFLYAFCLISWWDPFDYATSHTYHHRYTTHPEADRENLLPITPSLHPWLMLQLFTINLFSRPGRNFGKGGFLWTVYLTARSALSLGPSHTSIPSQEWLQALHNDQPEAYRRSGNWSRVLLAFHTSVLIVTVTNDLWILPLIITLPSFIASCGSYFLGVTQHCGLQQNVADFRKNTRSIRLNPVMQHLYWHMNWHIEHHMYAGVPCYNLKSLAREIESDMPAPRSLLGAWQEMREIWRRQQTDCDYQFDTPVPDSSPYNRIDTDDPLVDSIGDLAPVGLDTSRDLKISQHMKKQ